MAKRMKKAGKKMAKKTAKKVGGRAARGAGAAPVMKTRRDDFGAPVERVLGRMQGEHRRIGEELRRICISALKKSEEAVKWGHVVYWRNGMVAAIVDHRSSVNLQICAWPETLKDPGGRLEGTGARMRHVKVRSVGEIDAKRFATWLKAAEKQRGVEA